MVAKLLPKSDPVHKVTIIPRGRALGVTMQLPEQDRYSYDRDYLLQRIAVLFGGRIAEEIFMHQMTTGAGNDFERATQMARDMVTRYGMSDTLGPMVYGENEGEVFLGRSITTQKNVSEATMQKVDAGDQAHHRRAVRPGAQAASRRTATRSRRWRRRCWSGRRSTPTRSRTSCRAGRRGRPSRRSTPANPTFGPDAGPDAAPSANARLTRPASPCAGGDAAGRAGCPARARGARLALLTVN